MAVGEILTGAERSEEAHDELAALDASRCPRCGSDWQGQSSVRSLLLRGMELRRCPSCGVRFAIDAIPPREIATCDVSGLPFFVDELLPDQPPISPGIRSGRLPEAFTDPDVIAATELEVRRALNLRWNFVTENKLASYLDRILHAVALRIPGAPDDGNVIIVDDQNMRTLALPSGTVLISLGTLAALEDEAELAFVLAHEMAHVADGDAGSRLVWLSMEGLSKENDVDGVGPWAAAAHELIRLGHGSVRELEADRRALEAILELDYDPDSALNVLTRLESRIRRGSERCAEIAAAHPPPTRRIQALRRQLTEWSRNDSAPKVNRAVYRQAAGHTVLRERMEAAPGLSFEEPAERPVEPVPNPGGNRWRTAIAIGLLATLFLILGLLLGR